MSVVSNVVGSSRLSATFTQTIAAGAATILPNAAESLQATINQSSTYVNAASGVVNSTDLIYGKLHAIVSTTPLTINLGTGGALTDIFGQTITIWGRIRELIIQNLETAAAKYLNVYAEASNGWVVGLPLVANQLTIPPGGILHLADPLSFGGTTGLYVPAAAGTFSIDAASGTCSVNVLIAGCSVT